MRAESVQKSSVYSSATRSVSVKSGNVAVGRDAGEQLVGDAGLDGLRRSPTEAHRALVDDGDLHAHELVQPPVEAGAPDRHLEPADRLGELGTQREGTDDFGAVAVGKCDASHAASLPARLVLGSHYLGAPGAVERPRALAFGEEREVEELRLVVMRRENLQADR